MTGRFGKGPSLRQISGNVFSDKVPGGNLISAVLDRQLMAWSDRGGASRVLGDRWSEQCTSALAAWIGAARPVPDGPEFVLNAVARLDDDPRIAIQAGQHKLTNPDFVLYGHLPDASPVLQAADAKFAVDTIKPAQVSSQSLEALLAVEGGLVREAVERTLGAPVEEHFQLVRGVFLSPVSPLTAYFLPRVVSHPRSPVDPAEVVLIPANISRMFSGLPVTPLIGFLARVDRLSTSPRENLLAAIYYFRCASASAWLWVEERTPLLSLNPPPALNAGELRGEVERRAGAVGSAFDLLTDWYGDVEEIGRRRKSLAEVAAVPVSMKEIRQLVEAVSGQEDRALVRRVRGGLERSYKQRLVELVGEIQARPADALPVVLERVAKATRELRPGLRQEAERLARGEDTTG